MKEFKKGGDIIVDVKLLDDNDNPIDFNDYNVDILFYTMSGDKSIRVSSVSGSDIEIIYINNNTATFTIIPSFLNTLREGNVTCEMRLTDKLTGVKSIVGSSAFILVDSEIARLNL